MKPEQKKARPQGPFKVAAPTGKDVWCYSETRGRIDVYGFDGFIGTIPTAAVRSAARMLPKPLKSPAPSKRKGSAGMQHFAKFLESTGHLLEVQNRKPTKVRASVAFDNEHARGTISGEAVGKPSKRKAGRK